MKHLRSDDGFGGRGDDFYESVLNAHRGLSDADSGALNARLVLLLANHIGDLAVVEEALTAAQQSLTPEPMNRPQES